LVLWLVDPKKANFFFLILGRLLEYQKNLIKPISGVEMPTRIWVVNNEIMR